MNDTNRPYVICHMLTSLDGKIDGEYMSSKGCTHALQEYGKIREYYGCQATLYGTVTVEGSYAEGIVSELPQSHVVYGNEDYVAQSDVNNYIVAIDTDGKFKWTSKYIEKKRRPKAHIIEVLTNKVSNDYIAYLRELDISYIFVGNDSLDLSLLLSKLKVLFGIDKLMIAGGGYTNWSFVQDNLIDELSIVVAPVADGNTESVSIFEKSQDLPYHKPAVFNLKDVQRLAGDSIWLRYILA